MSTIPKLLKDVKENIKTTSTKLFIEYGYMNIDMRMISKQSGVSVGTLYNHYKNKKQLYISILYESWENTFKKLDNICNVDSCPKEKLKNFITVLYEDIEARKGLGRDLINTQITELKEDSDIISLNNKLIFKIQSFIASLDKVDPINKCFDSNHKLAQTLLVSILTMYELNSNDKEENIKFLITLMNQVIK